jgi:signal recognition particle receptor subunit beta
MDDPVRIAVMGMTGAGKSTFIKTLIPEAEITIGEDMNSRKLPNDRVLRVNVDIRNNSS